MPNQDEVREEFIKGCEQDWLPQEQIFYASNNKQGYLKDMNLIADWWLAKFGTLLAKKREETSEKFNEELQTWIDFTERKNITEEERFFAKIKVGILQDFIGRLLS